MAPRKKQRAKHELLQPRFNSSLWPITGEGLDTASNSGQLRWKLFPGTLEIQFVATGTYGTSFKSPMETKTQNIEDET